MDNPVLFSVEAFNEREPHHFAAVNKHYFRQLFYLGKGITGDKWVTEDIIQDLFVKLWTNGKVFDSLLDLKSYLVRSVTNASINYVNEEKRHQAVQERLAVDVSGAIQPEVFCQLSRMEVIALMRSALDALPPKCGEVMRRLYVEDQSRQEVAGELGISVVTVDNHRQHALGKLRSRFPLGQWKDDYLLLMPYVFLLGYSVN